MQHNRTLIHGNDVTEWFVRIYAHHHPVPAVRPRMNRIQGHFDGILVSPLVPAMDVIEFTPGTSTEVTTGEPAED